MYKALVGISPSGAITFVSGLYWEVFLKRNLLTSQSGVWDLLERSDAVMTDRGFNIQDDLTSLGVKLNILLYLKRRSQLTKTEIIEGRRIALARKYVRTCNGASQELRFLQQSATISFK